MGYLTREEIIDHLRFKMKRNLSAYNHFENDKDWNEKKYSKRDLEKELYLEFQSMALYFGSGYKEGSILYNLVKEETEQEKKEIEKLWEID